MILKNLRSILENLPKSAKVLDIGAGLAVALNEIHVQYGLEVIGTGVASRPDSLCPLVEAVAVDLPYSDCSFDLVMSFNSISWEPDQYSALAEARRVTKPSGFMEIFLLPFSYVIWLSGGEDGFWQEAGIDPHEYRQYEFAADRRAKELGLKASPVELHHPHGEYKEGYYITRDK